MGKNKYAHLRSDDARQDRKNRYRKSSVNKFHGCVRKRQMTEDEARSAAKALSINCYLCPLCECWHLTKRSADEDAST